MGPWGFLGSPGEWMIQKAAIADRSTSKQSDMRTARFFPLKSLLGNAVPVLSGYIYIYDIIYNIIYNIFS